MRPILFWALILVFDFLIDIFINPAWPSIWHFLVKSTSAIAIIVIVVLASKGSK